MPTVVSVLASPAPASLNAGKVVLLTVTMSGTVFVTGTPTLALNDGGVASYIGGSGSNALVFSYTVAAGQNTSALAAWGITLPSGASITDNTAAPANLTGAATALVGPVVIDTTAPTVTSVALSPTTGAFRAGNVLTLTVNMSEPVFVVGAPVLNLNDGGTASYISGSGTKALTFSYTVQAGQSAGQNYAALATTWITLPTGASIKDGAGNYANLAGVAKTLPASVVIDTTPPTVSSITTGPANADLAAGQVVTFVVILSEAVSVSGTPTLALNDGGSATYSSGSGTPTLTFKYTVAAGQNTPALAVTGSTLPAGASITDLAGNAADLSGALTSLSGRVIVDTTRTRTTIATGTGQTVNAGSGNDVVTLSAGSASLAFHGNNDIAFLGGGTGAVNATITDLSSGLTVYVLKGGTDVFAGFARDPSAVVDLLGGLGGYTSAGSVVSALISDGNGGSKLPLGSGQYIDFTGVAPTALHAANFQIG